MLRTGKEEIGQEAVIKGTANQQGNMNTLQYFLLGFLIALHEASETGKQVLTLFLSEEFSSDNA